jgi:hypothetical protein
MFSSLGSDGSCTQIIFNGEIFNTEYNRKDRKFLALSALFKAEKSRNIRSIPKHSC